MEAVAAAWQDTPPNADPFRIKALQSWSQQFVGSIRLQLAVAREVIQRLETAQEKRHLTPQEQDLRKELKMKTLGLASLTRTIARQRSRIQYLAQGDANTKFFQLQACHRRRKNYIHSFRH